MYENKKILILGAAKSGISVAKLLAKNNDVTLTDIKEIDNEEKKIIEKLNIKIIITDNQIDLIDSSYDLIIKNPAIMYTSEVYQKCLKLGLKIENEIEVGYHFLPKNVFIIGVTGSNGKTTTITIINELLKRMNKDVILCGNIGMPLCSVLDNIKDNSILLMEISDHQLLDLKDFKTNISVLTNIYKTHLDYHGTYEHYKETKKMIFNNETINNISIINKDNKDSLDITKDLISKKIYFNDDNNYITDDSIYVDNEKIIDIKDINIVGKHNYENILVALLVIKEFGLDKNIIKEFLKSFNGVEHRIEYVNEINGVKYYNDSKSTNPTSTITALKVFNNPVNLILGGLNRNQDFNELNAHLINVKCIYAIGETTDIIFDYAKSIDKPCKKCYNLKRALDEILSDALINDIVLLSPGSASQDQYKSYEERGIHFKRIVNEYANRL